MSIKIMSSVWASNLPSSISVRKRSSVKLVLLKLADNANDFGKCWPSIPRIAHETEMCEKSVERSLKELRDSDLIHVQTKRVNGVKHNTYYINIPLIESLRSDFETKPDNVNDNPFLNSLQTISPKPTDNWSENKDYMSVKPSLTINESSILQAFYDKKGVSITELDKEEFQHCHYITYLMSKSEYQFYLGKLSMTEWEDAESKMSAVDIEHEQFISHWIANNSKTMRKKASLTDLLSTRNGVEFEEYYQAIEQSFDL